MVIVVYLSDIIFFTYRSTPLVACDLGCAVAIAVTVLSFLVLFWIIFFVLIGFFFYKKNRKNCEL